MDEQERSEKDEPRDAASEESTPEASEPEQDSGMDLDGPFLTALHLFNEERSAE